jgi:hypothetical protein
MLYSFSTKRETLPTSGVQECEPKDRERLRLNLAGRTISTGATLPTDATRSAAAISPRTTAATRSAAAISPSSTSSPSTTVVTRSAAASSPGSPSSPRTAVTTRSAAAISPSSTSSPNSPSTSIARSGLRNYLLVNRRTMGTARCPSNQQRDNQSRCDWLDHSRLRHLIASSPFSLSPSTTF